MATSFARATAAAGPVDARIDIDDGTDANPGPGGRGGQGLRPRVAIDGDEQFRHESGDGGQPRQRRCADHRRGDEQAAQTGRGRQRLRLAGLGDAEADRPRRQLAGRDGLAFVGLGMGAKGKA